MIVTEQEAREKWCPAVRFHGTPSDDNMSNRDGGIDDGNPGMSRCVGSRCMAWRWVTPDDVRAGGVAGIGFCGLAGKP